MHGHRLCSYWRPPRPDNDEILELDDSVLIRHMMNANWFDLHRDDACASVLPLMPYRVAAIGLQDDAATQDTNGGGVPSALQTP